LLCEPEGKRGSRTGDERRGKTPAKDITGSYDEREKEKAEAKW